MPSVKLRAGGYWNNVDLTEVGDRWSLSFRYSPAMIAEIKAMEGARWNPGPKTWTVLRSPRNKFTLGYLMGKPVFAQYEKPLETVKTNRTPFCGHRHPTGPFGTVLPCTECGCKWCLKQHQMVMISHALTRKRSIIAGKPGTGKTLVYIEVLEATNQDGDIPWCVGPDSAIQGMTAEFRKWNSLVTPRFMTYDGLKRILATWKDGDPPPKRVIFDECSRLKGHKTQRSEAALFLSHQMEMYWKGEELIVEGSGTPAPNEPVDWWMQAEVARPGYLKESSWYAERKRLAIIEERQGLSGYYPALLQWRDGSACVKCAERKAQAEAQQKELGILDTDPNKQALLESILVESHEDTNCEHCGGTGFVPDEVSLISRRLDGLVLRVEKPDLPEKQYRVIKLEPAADVLRAAEIVASTASNALDALNRLRQLSDGFLYDRETHIADYAKGSAKEQALKELLDEYSEQGRLIVYAAYTASINRICELAKECGWLVWRYDGKQMDTWDGRDFQSAYATFQDHRFKEKIVYVAHPQKGGMSLTLTAAVAAVFYSNDFQGESREQAEDRIHRMGMDENKGATIIDLIHLGSDQLVRDRLMEKRDLQGLSLSAIRDALHAPA